MELIGQHPLEEGLKQKTFQKKLAGIGCLIGQHPLEEGLKQLKKMGYDHQTISYRPTSIRRRIETRWRHYFSHDKGPYRPTSIRRRKAQSV